MLSSFATLSEVEHLFRQHHGYKSVGGLATYCFAVREADNIVAAYTWQPPPPGCAKSVCPEAPEGVLSLSRMVAVPKTERNLKHVSKPLMEQMKKLIDRTRYPVLVTFSDSSLNHTGYVYQCSGWTKTRTSHNAYYENPKGERTSIYSNGGKMVNVSKKGVTVLQRWEHRICEPGSTAEYMRANGWIREEIPGKKYRSGNPAYRYVKRTPLKNGLDILMQGIGFLIELEEKRAK